MPLSPGTTLGPYEIQSPLGAGGMGEVYKARDTRLDRTVAIKVLLAHVADDPDLRQRFEREAKTISSLNHPHICTLYDIGQQDGIDYLVMEYLEGETLAARLTKGPLPTDQVLRYATEIADALDKAHRKGITHRDLKPGNIMITKAGTKLLDFGLAKLKHPAAGPGGMTAVPTLSAAGLTMQGTILGTLQYMAPEQLEGTEADARTDIFAFGAVLYEMATGRKAFEGKSQASLISAIMTSDPPTIASLQPMSPPALEQIVKTCLAKDPEDRWQSAGDLGRQLKIIQGGSQPSVAVPVAPTSQRASWRQGIPLAVATLVVGSLLTGIGVWSLMRSPAPRLERFPIPPPAPLTVAVTTNHHDIAITPDGTRVVYLVRGGNSGGAPFQLYVRAVEELASTPLQIPNARVRSPFVSPESDWVGFFDSTSETLKKVSILGGPAVLICSVGALRMHGASWGPDETIVFGTDTPSGLWWVSSNGGEPEELTTPDEEQGQANHAWPHILPGGRAVLFTIIPTDGAIETAQIAVLNLATGEQSVLIPGGSNPHYSPTGHIVYGIGDTLRAVRFDLDRLEVTDPNPVPVLDGVITKGNGAADFDLASDGSLVYVAGQGTGGAGERTAVWVDRQGNELPLNVPARQHVGPRLSPNGTHLAVFIPDPENTDVWVSELARGSLSRLTDDPALDVNPLWTPGGERVVFASQRDGPWGLFWVAADGTGEVEHLMTIDDAQALRPYAWSADGSTLVFEYETAETGRNIGMLSLEGERPWELLLDTMADEFSPAISPGGDWIAYTSDETDQFEIYAQRFPELGSKVPISAGRGRHPVWSPDGGSIFFEGHA